MKELGELTREIWNKLPRLIYEDEFELFDESNGYRHTEKLLIPEPPMLNDVIDWLSFTAKSELVIDFYGGIGEVVCERGGYYISSLAKWNLSEPYLKDQSPELINFLHSLIKTKQ
ncbi:hypothetical protein OWR28_02475 [Chryseobacterium sp. 1B4]